MLKHVYKVIVFTFAFFIAIVAFGQNIKEEEVSFDTTVEMSETTFPVLHLQTEENEINLLHGYSGSLDANIIRESITPIESDGSFTVIIDEKASVVKRLKYEIRSSYDNTLIESHEINALKKTETGKSVKIKLETVLDSGKEYSLRLTTVTGTSKKIHYYTRLKSIDDGHLKEKIEFVMDFHIAALDKKKGEGITKYLEPDSSVENKSLAHVTINSSFDQVTFGGMNLKVVGNVIPTVKESNIETATIELCYVATAKTDSGTEFYNIKEYYRVRYTTDRMYLLNYERFMESVFDVSLTSLMKSEFKVGITSQPNMEITTDAAGDKLCFVRERELWYYNLNNNKAVNVFSFRQENTDYVRDNYDQHDVRVLNMDEEGNIDFIVYGYMNRGDYEGRVGIILYKFYAEENRIEEQVYIPVTMSYQILKENLNDFSYVNRENVFYFSLNHNIYAYNIITNNLTTIVSDVSSDSFLMSKEGKLIAWQNSSNLQESSEVTLLDLETGARKSIFPKKGECIKLFGSIGSNIIYGSGKTKDIVEMADGRVILPAGLTQIADKNGNVLKDYKKKDVYVSGVQVKDNIVELERIKKAESGDMEPYTKVKPDFILNNVVEKDSMVSLSERVTEKTMTEYYITLPAGFVMAEKPEEESSLSTIITENSTLNLKDDVINENQYYCYALDGVIGAFDSPGDAIILSDEKMGTVLNGKYQTVWERGGKFARNSIDGIEKITSSGGKASINACIRMLLTYNLIHISESDISGNDSIYTSLKKNMKTEVLNLTGCNLDEVLYYVSKGRPVIAMKDSSNAVLIIGYDEFNVTYMDPTTGTTMKKGLNDGGDMFEGAGNVFFSYMEE